MIDRKFKEDRGDGVSDNKNSKTYFSRASRTGQDMDIAKQFFTRADKNGHLEGTFNLGLLLMAEGDRVSARSFLEIACRAGYNPSEPQLAGIQGLWSQIEKKVQAEREEQKRQAENEKYHAEIKKLNQF